MGTLRRSPTHEAPPELMYEGCPGRKGWPGRGWRAGLMAGSLGRAGQGAGVQKLMGDFKYRAKEFGFFHGPMLSSH